MDKALRVIGCLVLLGASGCSLLFGPDSSGARDAAAEESDAAAEEGDGGMDIEADGAAPDARPPFDCASLRNLEPPFAEELEALTQPIYAGNPLKLGFKLDQGTDLGVEIASQDPTEYVGRAEKVFSSCEPAAEMNQQAAHCGVPEAGFYCAFVTTREDGGALSYHGAIEIEALGGGESQTCAEILEEGDQCDWGVITQETCDCLNGGT